MTEVRQPTRRFGDFFGALEQRELEYMAMTAVRVADRLLFVVLRVRSCKATETVRDRIDTLARWSGMSSRQVQYGLERLQQRGLITRTRSSRPEPGGPRGHAWTWTTVPLGYGVWPTEPIARIVATVLAYIAVFYPYEHQDAGAASSSSKSAQGLAEEDAAHRGRARTPTRRNREPDLEVSSESLSSTRSGDEAATSTEVGRLVEAWARVRQGRRFGDRMALRWLREAIESALRDGCHVEDLDAALARHAGDEFADPRDFDRWAAVERSDRHHREAADRAMRARLAREHEHDERVCCELEGPESAAKMKAILTETAARLRMTS